MSPVRDNWTYVYVLQSRKSGKLYTGCASSLRKRLEEHNSGKSVYTKGRGPFETIYFEGCKNDKDAFAREKYLKTGMGKRFVKTASSVSCL